MMKTARRSAVIVALVSLFVQLFIPVSMALAASMNNTKVQTGATPGTCIYSMAYIGQTEVCG